FFSDPFFRDFENYPVLLEKESTELFPAINLIEDDTCYIIELAAPGFAKNEFDIEVEDRNIVISAKKEDKKVEKTENYTRKEFSYNQFQRSFLLPENVDENSIQAKFNDGVLRLKLDKKEQKEIVNKRHIDVK
ncbi:MAG TPA: heat-shock protein Hsp20, partial [Flavobacteriales bacterium]|nr:heat-shock protein Hsp20 [Flavobacteriales bacterium]